MENLNSIDKEVDRLRGRVSQDPEVGCGNYYIVCALLLIAQAIVASKRGD